jgi:hypothetical protein
LGDSEIRYLQIQLASHSWIQYFRELIALSQAIGQHLASAKAITLEIKVRTAVIVPDFYLSVPSARSHSSSSMESVGGPLRSSLREERRLPAGIVRNYAFSVVFSFVLICALRLYWQWYYAHSSSRGPCCSSRWVCCLAWARPRYPHFPVKPRLPHGVRAESCYEAVKICNGLSVRVRFLLSVGIFTSKTCSS